MYRGTGESDTPISSVRPAGIGLDDTSPNIFSAHGRVRKNISFRFGVADIAPHNSNSPCGSNCSGPSFGFTHLNRIPNRLAASFTTSAPSPVTVPSAFTISNGGPDHAPIRNTRSGG